ncbi:MAG: 3-oxo-tetronate kinase [Pseudomonadota bacterium]
MKLGVIADDFTGASDIALTLAEGGMKTMQLVGTPEASVDCDAGVVSLKSRTAPLEMAISQSLAACHWLLSQGCEQIVFKVCSTFDSTDEGNIGQVAEALAERLGETRVIVCPAFPENGRSIYQGHLFVGDRLLNESGMENHPLTPMTDPDLRRVLARQTSWKVGHIAADKVFAGARAIMAELAGDQAMLVTDAVRDQDLYAIGKAAAGQKLLVGGSGIALGLPRNFGHSPASPRWSGVSGGGVVLSGSCSIATRNQISKFRNHAPALELRAEEIMEGSQNVMMVADWVMTQDCEAPLVYSSAEPEIVRKAQKQFGKDKIANKIETLFGELAGELEKRGITRIVSAGGETSGAIVDGLNIRHMTVGTRITAGVPAMAVDGRDLAIALKSGNFGDEDFFETALNVLAGNS